MAAQKLPIGILLIDKDRFDIYLPDKKSVVSFPFAPEIIKDCEVLDRELLYAQIKSFIDNNKLVPSSLIIVLSKNLLFEKDFAKEPTTSEEQQQAKSQEFTDSIPFEAVGSITIPLGKIFKVIGANADLYKAILAIFTQSGFSAQVTLPATLYGGNVDKLNPESIAIILQKSESLKKFSLSTDSGNFVVVKQEEIKKKNSYMTILAVIMFIIAGCLVIFALFFLK